MSHQKHNKGLHETFSEIGFGVLKYFEGTITGTLNLTLIPPAHKLLIRNADTINPIFINVNGGPASSAVGLFLGDNIKLRPEDIMTFDFDNLHQISIHTPSASGSFVEATVGYKGFV